MSARYAPAPAASSTQTLTQERLTMMPSPIRFAVAPDGIPDELKQLDQWVVWEPVFHDGRTYYSLQSNTLRPFNNARALRNHGWPGIGFVLTADDPFCMIALLKCVKVPADLTQPGEFTYHRWEIDPWARSIVNRMASYAEVIPNGTGLTILIKGRLTGGNIRRQKIEILDRGVCGMLTGACAVSSCWGIEDRQDELDILCRVTGEYDDPDQIAEGFRELIGGGERHHNEGLLEQAGK
jgi:primase-polymerase (primpol)-like protein